MSAEGSAAASAAGTAAPATPAAAFRMTPDAAESANDGDRPPRGVNPAQLQDITRAGGPTSRGTPVGEC